MSEPFAKHLSRFTPDGTGLDRDALLFAAGRASARPHRFGIALATVLAATQLLTLALLWPRPTAPTAVPLVAPGITTPVATAPPAPPDPSAWWVLQSRALAGKGDLPAPVAVAVDPMLPSDPPLRAFTLSSFLSD